MAAGAVPVGRPGEVSWRQSSAACWAVGPRSLSSWPRTRSTCSQLQPLTSGCYSSWSYTRSFLCSVENKTFLILHAIKYTESFTSRRSFVLIITTWRWDEKWKEMFGDLGSRASIVILTDLLSFANTHKYTFLSLALYLAPTLIAIATKPRRGKSKRHMRLSISRAWNQHVGTFSQLHVTN